MGDSWHSLSALVWENGEYNFVRLRMQALFELHAHLMTHGECFEKNIRAHLVANGLEKNIHSANDISVSGKSVCVVVAVFTVLIFFSRKIFILRMTFLLVGKVFA